MALQYELPPHIQTNVRAALDEDVRDGDLTAQLILEHTQGHATVITRQDAVLCGTQWFDGCFKALDPDCTINWFARDGDAVKAGQKLCEIRGNARAMLTAERAALNFLQTLSATATLTRRHVEAVAGTRAKIMDTRKTLPGLRMAQKYAVKTGGGHNQRIGLFDGILIKENHIMAAGGIRAALEAAFRLAPANGHGMNTTLDDETRHARWPQARNFASLVFPHPNPLGETTSHSTKLPKSAAKSLVIPQAGEGTNESLREFHVNATIQIEVENSEQLRESLDAGAKLILLDNFGLDDMRAAVAFTADRAELEASGGINLETVRAIAETGVDRISIGGLTKDIQAVDLSMRFA